MFDKNLYVLLLSTTILVKSWTLPLHSGYLGEFSIHGLFRKFLQNFLTVIPCSHALHIALSSSQHCLL